MKINIKKYLNSYLIKMISLIIGLIVLFIFHIKLNDYSPNKLNLTVIPNDNIFRELLINITYKGNGKDALEIVYRGSNKTENVQIWTSKLLAPEKTEFIDNINYRQSQKEGLNREHFGLNESKNNSFRQKYEGAIFENLSSDISTKINLSCLNQNETSIINNTKIVITNIEGLNISSIYPIPDTNNLYSITYSNPNKIEELLDSGIIFNAENKPKERRNRNIIFVIGLLIGVLFSGFIDLILRKRERNTV